MPVRPIEGDVPEQLPTRPAAVENPLGQTSREQEVWHKAENLARTIVRQPQRVDPGIGGFFVPKDTSDQMVVDVTAQIVMRQAADELHLSSERIKDIYANESEAIIAKAPETFVYAGTQMLDENLTHTLGESLHWLSTQYGDDYVAPWLQTYMINNNVAAAKTRAVIEQIAMEDIGAFSPGTGSVTNRAFAQDQLTRIVDGTLQFEDLSPQEQRNVQNLAIAIRSEGEQVAATGTDRISKGLWIYSSGDYGMALTDNDTQMIDQIIELGNNLGAGRTDDLEAWKQAQDRLGIDQIESIDGGVLVLDEDWAVAHPDNLAAIGAYLEQRYPDVHIQIGRDGVVGTALEMIGESADRVGSLVGAGIHQLAELQEAYGGDDSKPLLARAASLRKALELGAVPEDEVDDTLHEIGRLEEDATSDLGWGGYVKDVATSNRNANQGAGFGEMTAQSFGVMPGDTGYGAMTAAWTIFGQIAFDPTTWVIPFARASTLAKRFPLIELEKVPTEAEVIKVITETPEMVRGLGVAGMTEAQITNRIARVARVQVKNFERMAANGIPDAVHGILTKRLYKSVYAKNPTEWLASKPYRGFVEGLNDTRLAIDDAGVFAAQLARSGIAPDRAILLAGARDINDMHLAYGSSLLPAPNSPVVLEIDQKIDDITDQLAAGRNALVESYPEGTVFHGTQAPVENLPDISKADVLQYGNPKGLAGPGLYLTDNSDVAGLGTKGYSSTRGGSGPPRVLGGRVNPNVKLLDAEAVLPDEVSSSIDDWVRANGRHIELPDAYTSAGKSWMEAIKELKMGLADADASVLDAAEMLTDLQYKLEQAHGYGGLTHTGGINPARPGKPTHGVTVLWDTGDTPISAKISHVPPGPPEPATMAAFRNVETDLMARKAWLESLKKPTDVTQLGMGLPPKRVLNRIVKLGEETRSYDKPQYAMDVVTAALTDQKFGWRERLFVSMNHLYEQAGLSREVFLTGPKVQESITYLDEFARYMRIPEGRIGELFAPWIAGDLNEQQLFRWWNDTEAAIIRETPTMGAAGKTELLAERGYNAAEGERVADYVNVEGSLPTATLPVTSHAGGIETISGRPATSAGELRTMSKRLPSARTMRSYQTMAGRTLNRMDHAGRVARRSSAILHGVGAMWYAFNDAWRTFMLASRPLGLAGRVTLEQQIRIAAFGYAGIFNHPIQMLESTGLVSKMSANQFSLFTDTADYSLGAMIDDATRYYGKNIQTGAVAKPGMDTYIPSVTAKLAEWGTSPETNRYFIKGLADPDDWSTWDVERSLAAFDEPVNKMVADHWRDVYENQTNVADVREGLERSWRSMNELLGSGDDDVMNWLHRMVIRRKATFEGKQYKLGTKNFTEKLEELSKESNADGTAMRWMPGAHSIPLDKNLYAPAEHAGVVRNIANAGLRQMFTNPDLAASRSPMYRQVADREFNTLIGYGYPIDRAHAIAQERAAAQVADNLFELGVHTPGEVFWKNLNPFFPAWRELFTTWLLRVPMRLGGFENRGLAWALGATALTRRVDAAVTGLHAGGYMETNSDGQLVFKVGGKEIPVQSIAGIFPLPLSLMDTSKTWPQRLQGVAPTLGATATVTLGALEHAVGEDSELGQMLEYVENWVAPYGTDTSLGPTAVDALMEGVGLGRYAVWQFGQTREAHEALLTSSKIDGMRIWKSTHPKPTPPPDVATETQFDNWNRKVLAPYIAEQVAAGERYARSVYVRKGLMGMFVPFRVDSPDEGKRATEEMWQDMALIRDLDIPGLSGKIIDDFLTEHPQLESYLTGKFMDERLNITNHETIETFYEGVQNGDITVRAPIDWAVFNYGRTTLNFMQRRISQEEQNLREVGREGFADYLLNPNAEDTLDGLQQSMQNFREWSSTEESVVQGQSETFASMLTRYEKYRDARFGSQPSLLDTTEEHLLQLSGLLSEFDRFVALDPEKSDDYQGLLNKVFKKLGESPSADWFDDAKQYFYEHVNGPYYDRYIPLLEKIDETAVRFRAPLYDELRALARRFHDPRTHDGIVFPSPEEYQWSRWNPKEQRSKVAHWAALNPMYLTEFQREQVGYSIPNDEQNKVDKLQDFASKVEAAYTRYGHENGFTAESRAIADRYIYDRAKELNLNPAYVQEIQQPKYRRIGDALNADERTATWESMVHFADITNRYIEDSDYGDKTANRERVFDQFIDAVNKAAVNDPALNALLEEIIQGVGPSVESTDPSDVLLYVFFDYFPDKSDDFPLIHLKET